ncbi:recombinase family protein [Sulfurimonas sp. SAG-AH-194-I05]|nr:recombinase family protein [Sulfurimonas sp. SAG-AH-194-I05]MDF1875931.1 recombinase family protein [Sulfurimonas sp. SAG-AH-194-I05]
MKVGYCRVSSTSQNLTAQIELLQKAGCERIFKEKMSGRQMDNRAMLQEALEFVRDGDEFYVTRLDRCSRSVKDLHSIIDKLTEKSVAFKATEQDIDTTTSAGRLMIGLLSIVNSFEVDIKSERQAEGIASAKKRGVQFGAKPKFNKDKTIQAIELQNQGMTAQQIADEFEIGRSTLLRYISAYKKLQIAA